MREKKEINIQIGEQIRIARDRAALTQEQLAERIDVSTQYVSDLERGVVGVSIPTLKRICAALQVSSDQLLFQTAAPRSLLPLVDRCGALSEEQLAHLIGIIDHYLQAVSGETN
jgi:transcriptional regulator with XRE-family HTH domain